MADIDRMRAALVAARERIGGDRRFWASVYDECLHSDTVAEYDALLAQIDAALAQENPQ